MGGGCGPQRNQPKLTFRNHSWPHDSILVRHKQTQMCLQSNPKCHELISTKCSKYFFIKFLANFLLPYSLTHSLTDAFSQA